MDVKKFKNNFSQLRKTQNFHIVSNTALVFMLAVSLYANTQKETIVINGVNDSCQETIMSSNWMNTANHEKLGFFLATALGNITPDTAKYTDAAVMEYIAPTIYNSVKEAIHSQLQGLIVDRLTMQFFAERAFVEDGKTFVTGKGRLIGPTGLTQKFVRTYEFRFDVLNYTPIVTFIDVYDDVPHDAEWQRLEAKRAERAKGANQ